MRGVAGVPARFGVASRAADRFARMHVALIENCSEKVAGRGTPDDAGGDARHSDGDLLSCILPSRMRKIGILLAQLGTPDAPTTEAVRKYLAEFLADPRVVDLHRVAWWFILHGIILRRRPAQSAKLYQKIWTEKGSPLLLFSQAQADGLQAALAGHDGVEFRAEVAMRYGTPSTKSAIAKLTDWGADRILLFPMYPQYAAPTTGSTYDAVYEELPNRRFVPSLRVVPPYFDHPSYIAALAESLREKLAELPQPPEKILLSFHGIPQRYARLGDPYPEQCMATAQLLAKEMRWSEKEYLVTFQSRFGKEPWLQPYTDTTLMRLGDEGLKRVLVICPGFLADCLETIDEIGNLGKEQFQHHGGEILDRVECLNARSRWIDAMKEIALRELQGWM